MKILLIEGGWSSERDISIAGAKNIAAQLEKSGNQVTHFDLLKEFDDLSSVAGKHDFAFINLHGSPGEDGLVQAILDRCGCPYQGSGPAGSFLALHKAAAKQIFRMKNIPTPDWEYLPNMPDEKWCPHIALPAFVKSNTGGSSLGLFRASTLSELKDALARIFAEGKEAIIESGIAGKDITCAILGNKPLPPLLIMPKAGDFFDFESKYKKNGADELCPAPLDDSVILECQRLALECHKALGLRGISRTDMILDASSRLWVLETNTLPGMTSTSLVPQEASAAGLDFAELLDELIRLGIKDFHKS